MPGKDNTCRDLIRPSSPGRRTAGLLVMGLLTTSLVIGCGPTPPESTVDSPVGVQNPDTSPVHDTPALYEVRALVKTGGEPREGGRHDNTLRVHHEAIDNLVGIDGDIWGMDAMEMSFEVAEGVSLEGLTDGDAIELTLTVDWAAETPQQITAIEKLPADTELEFRPAKPPG